MTPERHLELADLVAELTRTHTHREAYSVRSRDGWETRYHATSVPSLLQQLWENDTPSAGVQTGSRPGFASKPAARLEALDVAARIDLDAARWVRDLGEDDHHLSTTATLQQLHALAASADAVTREAITRDVRRWWTQARIVTGWDSAPWAPDATCPMCGERGTLRVRLVEQIGMCTNDACRSTWGPEAIGLLADHIRSEADDARPRRDAPDTCWCPLPRPAIDDLAFLCPRCGSAACTHALGARLVDCLRDNESA